MTTAAITTATPAETAVMARGSAVFRRVTTSEWPGDGDRIREALAGLAAARETFYDLLNDLTHPASAYPELENDPEAYAKALGMAMEDTRAWADELDRLVPVTALKVGGQS
jgi:hypothetical protein